MAQLNEEILDSIDPDGAIPDPEMAGHKSRSEYCPTSLTSPAACSIAALCSLMPVHERLLVALVVVSLGFFLILILLPDP